MTNSENPVNNNGTANNTSTVMPPRKVTLQEKIDIQRLQDAKGERAHRMNGFDPKWRDIVDYIIGVTHEIWEEKAVGKLYDYYANTIQLHTSSGITHGRDTVLASTLAAMAAYPDRRLHGDEVIWGGDDVEGFYTSHRLTHSGTNRGWSLYGPATGKRINYRAIADCLCKENMIVEEWLVRDELTLVHQLGSNPFKLAREIAQREAQTGLNLLVPGDVERGIGQFPPSPLPEHESGAFEPEYFVRRMFQDVWNRRLLNTVRDYFVPGIPLESASMRRTFGHNNYQSYVLSLLSPFPDLAVTVEHSCTVGDEQSGYRTATRWRMIGTHSGYGIYGEPTGNPMQIMGISHHLIQNGRIQHEWTLFDEFALLKQIYRPKQ